MKEGKKTLAHKLLNTTFDILREKGYTNPEEVFDKALDNVMPKIECRPKRVGGAIYQVPTEVPPGRSIALAARWILDAYNNQGDAVKKKLDTHQMAEANKAFAHFARY
jgi:small subunit ribosomal protein S7